MRYPVFSTGAMTDYSVRLDANYEGEQMKTLDITSTDYTGPHVFSLTGINQGWAPGEALSHQKVENPMPGVVTRSIEADIDFGTANHPVQKKLVSMLEIVTLSADSFLVIETQTVDQEIKETTTCMFQLSR